MIIKKEHKDLRNYIDDIDQLLMLDDINELLLAIDDAILDMLDADGNPNEIGVKLQLIYDYIYSNG